MCISSIEPSSMILSEPKYSKRLKCGALIMQKNVTKGLFNEPSKLTIFIQ